MLTLYPLHFFGIKMFFAEHETMIIDQSLGFSPSCLYLAKETPFHVVPPSVMTTIYFQIPVCKIN